MSAKLIPRAVLFGNPERTGPQISPDGLKLAYLAPLDGVLNVWVRIPGEEDQAVTSDTQRPVRQFSWQGDSAHILYLQDQGGDENYHLYQTHLQTRRTRDLTPFDGARAQPLSIDPNWPDEALVSLNVRDPRLFDVYRIDLRDGSIALDTENPGDIVSWTSDNRMQVRAAQTALPDGGVEIRVREDRNAPWHPLIHWGPDESMGGVAGFTANNDGLRLLSSVDANAIRLTEVLLDGSKPHIVAEDSQFDVSDLLVHPHTYALEAVEFTRARHEWTLLKPELQPDFEALQAVRDGDIRILSRSLDDSVWTVAYTMDNGPTYFYAYARASRQSTLLFSNQPALESYTLAKTQPISFSARDGLPLHGYLTLPPDAEPQQSLPCVLLVHGGPWARDIWGYSPFVQWLANRGYVVMQINFRGSTGYGKAFLNAGDREWAGKMHTDLLDGKQWVIAQGIADPARIAIVGGSYGGYATLVGMAFTPGEFVCGVDIVGPSNILTLLQTIPPYWAPMVALFHKRLGNPDTDAEFLKSLSPLYKADQIRGPLLIAQGANDPRVKQSESDQIVTAMRANNLQVEYLVFPDEGHGFARPENNRKFTAAAEAFLAQHLGGRAEPPSPEEDISDLLQ